MSVSFTIPTNHRTKTKESEKLESCKTILWNMKVIGIQIIVGSFRMISKNLEKRLSRPNYYWYWLEYLVESWKARDLLSHGFLGKPPVTTGVKNLKRDKNWLMNKSRLKKSLNCFAGSFGYRSPQSIILTSEMCLDYIFPGFKLSSVYPGAPPNWNESQLKRVCR